MTPIETPASPNGYQTLLVQLSSIYTQGQTRAFQAVNQQLIETYWQMGLHIVELLKIDDPLERSFYQQQCQQERWSVKELIRQKHSALFLRLALNKDKAGILALAHQGQIVCRVDKRQRIHRSPIQFCNL